MDNDNAPKADELNTGQQIGDYLIGELLYQNNQTKTWSATQISVQREVTVCNLRENTPEATEAFMADIRTKATVDHPLISSVLEAVRNQGQCFYAREKLQGESLKVHYEEGVSIPPARLASIIRNIADACRNLENDGTATNPLTVNDVVIDDKFHCRITNKAVAGDPNPDTATQDKKLLGSLLHDILIPGQSGSTRTASLLSYMVDGYEGAPLSWEQIHKLSDGIEHQLSESKDNSQIKSPTIKMRRSIPLTTIAKIVTGIAILAIGIGIAYYISNRETITPERKLTDLVLIPKGKYIGPLGTPVKIGEFSMEAHEVTIGEYAKFLKALSVISAEQRTIYQHDDQPAEKADHIPQDWDALYGAATTGGKWNDMPVDLNYPVVGVDWWDAYTYAEWKGRRLPTRDEWYATCTAGAEPSALKGTGWMPVDQTEKTSQGIHAMAGNVSEWTLKRSFDPADPSQPARFIICGASYLKPKYGARAFEWVDDRSLRRADLGFRTCIDAAPEE